MTADRLLKLVKDVVAEHALQGAEDKRNCRPYILSRLR